MRGQPRFAAAPVANSIRVSDVEVSLSTVMALNEPFTERDSIACSASAAIGASVNTKDSMVAMSGAIMPAPLAMPLITTSTPPMLALRGRALRVGVGGHDRLGGLASRALGGAAGAILQHALELGGVQRLADDARRGQEDLARRQPSALAAISAVSFTAAAPVLPVNALALPELTTRPRALPPGRPCGTSRPARKGIWSG